MTFIWSSKILLRSWREIYLLFFFENDHIHNVVETLPEIVEFEVEHENFALTLSKVVQINVERGSIDLTLLNVLNSSADIDNVASTLIWGYPTSRCHINLKATLKQRCDVCWDHVIKFTAIIFHLMSVIFKKILKKNCLPWYLLSSLKYKN